MSNKKNRNEKRKSERVRLSGKVEIIVIDELGKNEIVDEYTAKHDLIDSHNEKIVDVLEGEIINISSGAVLTDKSMKKFGSGGMLIKTAKGIRAESELILTFELPFPKIKEDFALRAKTIRSIEKDDHYEIAISFEKILMHYTECKEFDELNYILNI